MVYCDPIAVHTLKGLALSHFVTVMVSIARCSPLASAPIVIVLLFLSSYFTVCLRFAIEEGLAVLVVVSELTPYGGGVVLAKTQHVSVLVCARACCAI
jgi:hypothetical protein